MSAELGAAPGAGGDAPQRWAIIGLGAQAEAIATALVAVPGVGLGGAASGSPERAREFAGKFGCRAHGDYRELVADNYDVVLVASANDQHAEQITAALEAGSVVFTEKPMTLTVAGAEAVLATSRRTGRPIYVGYHLRFQALSAELRQIVAGGELGELGDIAMQRYSAQQTDRVRAWRRDLNHAGAGVLCDVAVHLFDYIRWVSGLDVTMVSALANPPRRSGRPDEHVLVNLALSNGGLAVVDATRSLPFGENSLHLHGSGGSLCTGPLRWTNEFHADLRLADGDFRTLQAQPNDPLVEEMRAVRDACAGHVSPVLATGGDGLAGVAVLEAAIRSLAEGRAVSTAVTAKQEEEEVSSR